MQEALKHHRRRTTLGYFDRYIKGNGIDIGCGPTPFHPTAIGFDRMIDPTHNAEGPLPYGDGCFDYVHSSHCIEHMVDPSKALGEWWRVLKPFGHMLILAPDFGLYEQRQWLSKYNGDHKSVWNLFKLLRILGGLPGIEIISASRNDTGYSYEEKKYDRTLLDGSIADIEVVAQKVPLDWMFSSAV